MRAHRFTFVCARTPRCVTGVVTYPRSFPTAEHTVGSHIPVALSGSLAPAPEVPSLAGFFLCWLILYVSVYKSLLFFCPHSKLNGVFLRKPLFLVHTCYHFTCIALLYFLTIPGFPHYPNSYDSMACLSLSSIPVLDVLIKCLFLNKRSACEHCLVFILSSVLH